MTRPYPILAALALGACSAGQPLSAPPASLTNLHDGIGPIGRFASMTTISSDWALTNAHADGIASGLRYEAPTADLALVALPDPAGAPLPRGTVQAGDAVTMYGTGATGGARIAHGTVLDAQAFICWGKPAAGDADNVCKRSGLGIEWALVISGDAGPGFSGGPIVNQAGELVGIQSREFTPVAVGPAGVGGFTSIVSEGQLVARTVPQARPGEVITLAYPIGPALAQFFPAGDPAAPVLATAAPAEPSSWLARWGWVVLLAVL